jgi:hypothetical protein
MRCVTCIKKLKLKVTYNFCFLDFFVILCCLRTFESVFPKNFLFLYHVTTAAGLEPELSHSIRYSLPADTDSFFATMSTETGATGK